MKNIDENTITQAVIAAMRDGGNARLRKVMNSLVQHLHAFAREVELTEDEWDQAIRFLTAVGHITDDKRQEFILLSDVLGLSTLVTAQNHRKPAGCTEATVFGPFFVDDAPAYQSGDDIANGASGSPCFVTGRVLSVDGSPVASARIDVWQSDEEGFYDVQRPPESAATAEHRARGWLRAAHDGSFHFRSILAEAYPIPHDGPVGQLLEALGRHPWRPAHLHFMITAPGYEKLVTHIFRDGDQYLDSDAVFGVRTSLIAPWIRHEPGVAPDGTVMDEVFYSLQYDFVLNPADATHQHARNG
ncbi:intradiol ring-cleavage dioxygenase [Paraburkholderia sp. DHOC27]|uniref:intradiol ring-cleavage dioxygenase n=1 Tax=Paraburkholderia sp. DHOC27 TaxID=2303330 RepID=UPI000E3BD0B7|nr:intradiol ring-cleavage dioxygenase [Paraburkholderia sp. DHOC27]RFU49105.1 hydroxyquinol 1,2-dioxygenase [Paraburkholderia sp. DHOC27]